MRFGTDHEIPTSHCASFLSLFDFKVLKYVQGDLVCLTSHQGHVLTSQFGLTHVTHLGRALGP